MIRKVKNWLGIESVKVVLKLPETFDLKEGQITGKVEITSQSDQHVESVTLTFVEKYTRGRRKKSKLVDEYTIGEMSISIDQDVAPQQMIEQAFILPFEITQSGMDQFGSKNILYGGISMLAKLAKNAKSTYYLTAELDVRDNKLKPYDKVEVVAD